MIDRVYESLPDFGDQSRSFNAITHFMKNKIFRPETTDGGFEDQQVPKVSLTKIISQAL